MGLTSCEKEWGQLGEGPARAGGEGEGEGDLECCSISSVTRSSLALHALTARRPRSRSGRPRSRSACLREGEACPRDKAEGWRERPST